jgi:hypothetical protein
MKPQCLRHKISQITLIYLPQQTQGDTEDVILNGMKLSTAKRNAMKNLLIQKSSYLS